MKRHPCSHLKTSNRNSGIRCMQIPTCEAIEKKGNKVIEWSKRCHSTSDSNFQQFKIWKAFFSNMSCELYFIKNKVWNKAVHFFKAWGKKSRLSTSKRSYIYQCGYITNEAQELEEWSESASHRQAAAGRHIRSQPAWQIGVWKYDVSSIGSLQAECLWCYQTKISVYLDLASASSQTPGFTLSYVNMWLRRGGKGKTGHKEGNIGEKRANKNTGQSKPA